MRFSDLQVYSSMLALAVAACGHAGPAQSTSSSAAEARAPGACTVRGRALGHDGQPMKLAHVHLGDHTITADDSGRFCLSLTAEIAISARNRRFLPVRITGVDHAEHVIGLLAEGVPIDVDVQLGTHAREPSLSQVTLVVLELYRHELVPVAQYPMDRQPDGTYVAEVDYSEPELWYQLNDVARGRTVNGTHAESYVYDGRGDYVSSVPVEGDLTVVRLDPGKLAPPGRRAQVRFAQPDSRAARIAALYADMLARDRAYLEAFRQAQAHSREAASPPGAPAPRDVPAALTDGSWRAGIAAARAQESDPEVRAVQGLMYLTQPMTLDRSSEEARAIARDLLATLPADAQLWSITPYSILTAVELAGDGPELRAYIERMIASLGDPEAAAGILLERMILAARAQDSGLLARYYGEMKDRYGDTQIARFALKQFDLARAIALGRAGPAFDLPSLDRDGERLTPESFRGRVVLIDFWATWCKPCIEEMDNLHRTYEKYKDQGFTILSIATNDEPETVRAFRRGPWSMPWHNVVLTDENQADIKKRFEVAHLPFAILVDGKGTIVAMETALRGPALAETVAAVLAATGTSAGSGPAAPGP